MRIKSLGYFFWFFRQPTAKTPGPIFTINTSNDAVSRKNVPLGSPENKILNYDPYFSQKIANFSPIFHGTLKISRQKGYKIRGMLTCKLPLIVIVAQ